MVQELVSLYHDEGLEKTDPDTDSIDLDCFLGVELSKYYNKDLVSKHKKGDVILVNVLENHHRRDGKKIKTRVRIDRVNKFNPFHTYFGMQIDRRVEFYGPTAVYVDDPNKGSLGASFNDSDVHTDEQADRSRRNR
jgi:hypothetical protein